MQNRFNASLAGFSIQNGRVIGNSRSFNANGYGSDGMKEMSVDELDLIRGALHVWTKEGCGG